MPQSIREFLENLNTKPRPSSIPSLGPVIVKDIEPVREAGGYRILTLTIEDKGGGASISLLFWNQDIVNVAPKLAVGDEVVFESLRVNFSERFGTQLSFGRYSRIASHTPSAASVPLPAASAAVPAAPPAVQPAQPAPVAIPATPIRDIAQQLQALSNEASELVARLKSIIEKLPKQ